VLSGSSGEYCTYTKEENKLNYKDRGMLTGGFGVQGAARDTNNILEIFETIFQ
jgi:hypothetical protein